ncbi:hypothetical protein N308_02302, partial [Struthio camelus australis]
DQVVHVALGLGELHLVHALARVPVKEGLAAKHGCELLRDALEELLDGCAVADEGGGHLQPPGWDVAHSHLDVVGDPLNEVGAVLALDGQHLLIHLLHGHAAPEDCGHGEVAPVAGVTGCHHVLGIKHLLGELRDSEGPVLLAATGCQWGKARHEEVEAWEGHHVDCQLAEVGIELPGEAEGGGDAAHCG